MNKFLLVGSDPECFLRDRSGNVVSAIGIIPGTKQRPHDTPHGSIQVDNILAEFNSRPSASLSEFITNHKLILKDLEEVIKPMDLRLDFIASILADESLLSDPSSRIAGCEPDFDAWHLSVNEPADYLFNNTRGAGGHLHISFDQAVGSPEARLKMVRALDLVLGVPSVIHDDDKERRKYYGKAGAFRPKDLQENDPYDGVEYRTLSNFWLRSESLMTFVYNGIVQAYNNLNDLSALAESLRDPIISIINSGDSSKALQFCKDYGIKYA